MEDLVFVKSIESSEHVDCELGKELNDSGYECLPADIHIRIAKSDELTAEELLPESSQDSGVDASDLSKSVDTDELVVRKKKSKRIIEDDSSDDDEPLVNSGSAISSVKRQKDTDDGSNANDSSLDNQISLNKTVDDHDEEVRSQSAKSRTTLDEERFEDSNASQSIGRYKSILQNSDLFDSEEPDEQITENDQPAQESSEEAEEKSEKKNLKSSKQRQKKNVKTLSSIRKQKEDLMRLHSDSQRMLRESRVSLPYHQPEQKSLDYFLNRRKNVPLKLKPTLSDLKGMMNSSSARPRQQRKSLLMSGNGSPLEKLLASESESATSVKLIENICDPLSDDEAELPPSGIIRQKTKVLDVPVNDTGDTKMVLQGTEACESLEVSPEPGVTPPEENNNSESAGNFETLVLPPDTLQLCNDSELSTLLQTEQKVHSLGTPQMPECEPMQVEGSEMASSLPVTVNTDSLGLLQSDGDSEPMTMHHSEDLNDSQLEENSESLGSLRMEADSEEISKLKLQLVEDSVMVSKENSLNQNLTIIEKNCQEDISTVSLSNETSLKPPHLDIKCLPVLQIAKSLKPRLSDGGPSSFISLDDDDECNRLSVSPGVQDLMHRFVKHTRPAIRQQSQQHKVVLNIVKKEVNDVGKEVLVADTVSVPDNSCSPASYETPSVQRELLKETLRTKIAIRREQERQKRIHLFELDNEEGFAEKDGCQNAEAEEEEEAELTDQTDTEEEEEDESDEEVVVRKTKRRSAFIDDEAEDDDAEEDDMENEDDNEVNSGDEKSGSGGSENEDVEDSENEHNEEQTTSCNKENFNPEGALFEFGASAQKDNQEKESIRTFKRTITEDLFPPDYSEASLCSSIKSIAKDNKPDTTTTSMDVSFELLGSEIPAYQPYGGHHPQRKRTETPSDSETELFTPLTRLRPTQGKYELQLSPNGDDNQDLDSSFAKDHAQQSEEFDFSFQGSSRLTKNLFGESSPSHKALLGKNSQGVTEDIDELLFLCSGKFNDSQPSDVPRSKQFLAANSQNNMDELVGLCSGQFASGIASHFEQDDSMMSLALASDCDDDKDNEALEATQDTEVNYNNDEANSHSEDEEEENNSEEEEEEKFEDKKFTSFGKRGKIRQEFLEDEAELSGSEIDSDENDDISEDEDVMEEEEGDKDELLSEDELRNQVGRVHLKSMLDEDKRDLRLFQEVFLQDGELHSEGRGRERKFRWKDVDGNSVDGFDLNQSDEDAQDDAAEQEDIQWRMQRSEREKWLCENNVTNQIEQVELEGSQLLKFKTSLTRKSSFSMTPEQSEGLGTGEGKVLQTETFLSPKNIMKMMHRRGSFLSRSKETLSKLAEITKQSSDSNPNGPKHSRNFVFAAQSPTKNGSKKITRSVSDSTSTTQPAKRPKFDRTFSADRSRRNSVFSFL